VGSSSVCMIVYRTMRITAAVFILAGILHFVIPTWYADMIPRWMPQPVLLVYLSGVAEIVGGAGLLHPRTRTLAAFGLVVLLVAVFPAHIEMLQQAQGRDVSPLVRGALWGRLPLQLVLIWWVWRVTGAGRDLAQ
jgi:uncharacterized membrane protein